MLCCDQLPSLKATVYAYEVAPLPAAQANANVAPIVSVESRVTLGLPGASGAVEVAAAARLNVAVTVVAAVTVRAQEPVPEQAPLQPANVEPAAGAAVRVNTVSRVTDSEQSAPQLMPRPVTMPEPEPFLVTESV